MSNDAWSHNIQYHPLVLRAVPHDCARALDVGCGRGLLASKLAERCREVIAIDIDRETLANAVSPSPALRFLVGDVMTYPFAGGSFDLITAVASLHHLPLAPALTRLSYLLKSRGILAVIGLYKIQSPADYATSALAMPISWIQRRARPIAETGAPLRGPSTTLRTIRAACQEILPGAILRRRLFFRYSLLWRKP